MGRVSTSIDDTLEKFIRTQAVFFVATAPLDAEGHVNLSPKGLDTFRVLGPTTVAYLDLTGSGAETIAHVRENGRIVVMFCAFEGAPNILRLYGRGRVVEAGTQEFGSLQRHFPEFEGTRAIIVVEVSRIAESCGFGVPLMQYEGERPQLEAWARKKGPEGLKEYRRAKNRVSIDGLAGVE
jgi:predicted pyridoxine 5'-phosphate oxidase superfamily flavin-nucleotide-binding protein